MTRGPKMIRFRGSLTYARVLLGCSVWLTAKCYQTGMLFLAIPLTVGCTCLVLVLVSTAFDDQWSATGFPRWVYRVQRLQPPPATEEPDDNPEP